MFLTLRAINFYYTSFTYFYKFANSFYKVRTESLMTLAIIYINVMKPC